MKLQKSHYIHLWYIAGLVQFEEALKHTQDEFRNNCFQQSAAGMAFLLLKFAENSFPDVNSDISIASEDKIIFEGLWKVYDRFVKLFEQYEFAQPQDPQNIEKLAKLREQINDPEQLSICSMIMVIKEKGAISNFTVEERSFGLFKSISSAVDFYYKFLNILNLYEVICLLEQHPDIPLGNWILQNLYLLLVAGYKLKKKNNYDYSILDSAIGKLPDYLRKCLEKREHGFTFESSHNNSEEEEERKALEDYLQEMCEIYCACNRIKALSIKDSEKENGRRAKISATKTQKTDFWAEIKEKIFEWKKVREIKYMSDACKSYYRNHKDRFTQKDGSIISIRTVINKCSKNDAPHNQRSIYNSGTSIQTPFADEDLIEFGRKYDEWRKSQKARQGNEDGTTQA